MTDCCSEFMEFVHAIRNVQPYFIFIFWGINSKISAHLHNRADHSRVFQRVSPVAYTTGM